MSIQHGIRRTLVLFVGLESLLIGT